MSTERLNLTPLEPDDHVDPVYLPAFYILYDALQPESKLSVEDAVAQVTALLPEGKPYSTEVGIFLTTCYEIAEQIPYDHSSVVKLVTIMDLCLHSSRFPKVEGSKNMQTDPTFRYQKLGETLRDFWDATFPRDGPAKYINFQTFVARIYERGIIQGCLLPIWVVDCAFERRERQPQEEREAYVQAALQGLLLIGDLIYREVTEEDVSMKDKWSLWREHVAAVANEKTDDKALAWSQHIVELAGQALVAMDAIERLKAG